MINEIVTIVASALAGAAAVLGLGELLKRRRMLRALYVEMSDNYSRSSVIEEKGKLPLDDAFIRSPLTEFNTSVYESMKTKTPALLSELILYSDGISESYNMIDSLEYIEQSESTLYQKHDLRNSGVQNTAEMEIESMKQYTLGAIKYIKETTEDGREDIREFLQESLIRRIIYFRCLK